MSSKKPSKSCRSVKFELPPEDLFAQLHHSVDDLDDFPTLPPPSVSGTSPSGSLARELELVRLQKEKLQLELEVLRLKNTPPTSESSSSNASNATSEKKKRTIDWPQDFVPGTSSSPDLYNLDFPSFVAGFIAMIKNYELDEKSNMISVLELLSTKAMSYTWVSVRSFYQYIARQVEQRRLEWNQLIEIRDKSTIFFKHSDLRSVVTKSSFSKQTNAGNNNATNESLKGCQTWNYKGSCACDSSAENYAATHTCRVCKSSDHPMLNCPKRRMPIPGTQ